MIAGESMLFADLLDRVEMILRGLARQVIGIWRTTTAQVKILSVLVILDFATATGIGLIST
jgi:hypothetical protein